MALSCHCLFCVLIVSALICSFPDCEWGVASCQSCHQQIGIFPNPRTAVMTLSTFLSHQGKNLFFTLRNNVKKKELNGKEMHFFPNVDSGLFPVNIRLFTLQCGVLGDYFSYQTYLLITRQGCSLLETHALSPLPRGGVVQQQLDYLDELPLIAHGEVWFATAFVAYMLFLCRKDRINTGDRSLNPCCSCRLELLTQTRITALHKSSFV